MNATLVAEPTEYRLVELGEGRGRFSMLIPEPDSARGKAPFVEVDQNLLDYLACFEAGCSFLLTGPPGCGKTATIQALCELSGRQLFTIQGHSDIEPQDLAGIPRLGQEDGGWIGSPLMAAVLTGGVAYVDDIGKIAASERALSLLASVLDHRHTLQSSLMGLTLVAHTDFRFCCSMNSSDPPLPDYIAQRLLKFRVDYPSHRQLRAIVQAHFAEDDSAALLEAFGRWLSEQKQSIAPRDAITIVRFSSAMQRANSAKIHDLFALIEKAASNVLPRA